MNNQESSSSTGKLYIVSTPIGNKDDITLRAINTIKRCDLVVCEEMKVGAQTLKSLNLAKEMLPLNENNESEMTMEVLNMLREGKKIALISDAGTPVFADPGLYLVKSAISNNIDVEVVPGVSSIMTAIVRSGFELYEFLYAGFLPRKNEDRDRRLQKLARERRTVIIFETPYRLNTLLEACANVMPERRAYIAMNLTMVYETHHYGTFAELFKKFELSKTKSEFIIVMEGNKEWIDIKNKNTDDGYEDDDDDDDDEPVVYEYPVKAHQKVADKPRKVIKTGGGSRDRYSKPEVSKFGKDRTPKGADTKFSRERPASRDSGSKFGRDRSSSGEGSKFGRDRSSSGEGSKFGRDRSSSGEGSKFGKPRSVGNSKFSRDKSGYDRDKSSDDKSGKKSFGDRPLFKKNFKSDSPDKKNSSNNFSSGDYVKTDFSDNRHSDGKNFKSKSLGKFKGKSNDRSRGKR